MASFGLDADVAGAGGPASTAAPSYGLDADMNSGAASTAAAAAPSYGLAADLAATETTVPPRRPAQQQAYGIDANLAQAKTPLRGHGLSAELARGSTATPWRPVAAEAATPPPTEYAHAGLGVAIHGLTDLPRFADEPMTAPFVRVHAVSETTGSVIVTPAGGAVMPAQTTQWKDEIAAVPAWEAALHLPSLLDPAVLAHVAQEGILLLFEVMQAPSTRIAWSYLRLVPPHATNDPNAAAPLPRLGPHSLALLPYDRPPVVGLGGLVQRVRSGVTSAACFGCMRSDPYAGTAPVQVSGLGEAGPAYSSYKRLDGARRTAGGTRGGVFGDNKGFTGWRGAACRNAATPTIALRITLSLHEPNRMVRSIFGDPAASQATAASTSASASVAPESAKAGAVQPDAEELSRAGVPKHARRAPEAPCQVPLTPEATIDLPVRGATRLAFSQRGRLLAVACTQGGALNNAEVRVYAVELPGCPLMSRFQGHQAEIHALAWLPALRGSAPEIHVDALLQHAIPRGLDESTRLVTASSDYTAAVWDIAGEEAKRERAGRSSGSTAAVPLASWEHPCAVYAAAARPGAVAMAAPLVVTAGGDGILRLWVAEATKQRVSPIATLAIYVPDSLGRRMALNTVASDDMRACAVTALAFDHTGLRLFVGDVVGLVHEVGLDFGTGHGGVPEETYGLATEFHLRSQHNEKALLTDGASTSMASAPVASPTSPVLHGLHLSYALLGSPISAIVVVPLSRRVFVVGRQSHALLLEPTRLNPSRRFVGLKLGSASASAAASPDGCWMVCGSDRGAPALMSAGSDIAVAPSHLGGWVAAPTPCIGVAWSPTAHRIAYVGEVGGVMLVTWDGVTANPAVLESSSEARGGGRKGAAAARSLEAPTRRQRLPPLPDRLTPEDVSAMLQRVREEERLARRSMRASAARRS